MYRANIGPTHTAIMSGKDINFEGNAAIKWSEIQKYS